MVWIVVAGFWLLYVWLARPDMSLKVGCLSLLAVIGAVVGVSGLAVKSIMALKEVPVDWQHIFVAWGVWWWLLTIVFLLAGFALVTWQRGAYFLLSLLVYLGLMQFLGNTPVLGFIGTHYLGIIGLAAGFLAVAIFWFNWRWHWFTSKMRGRYNDVLGKWLHDKGLQDLPGPDDISEEADVLRIQWQEYFQGGGSPDQAPHNVDEFGVIEFRPRFRKHKDAILTWMAAWPLDMLVWLFAEVVRDFWNMVYYKFQGVLQAIMERNWRGTEGHMLSEEEQRQWYAKQRNKAEQERLPVDREPAKVGGGNAYRQGQ